MDYLKELFLQDKIDEFHLNKYDIRSFDSFDMDQIVVRIVKNGMETSQMISIQEFDNFIGYALEHMIDRLKENQNG